MPEPSLFGVPLTLMFLYFIWYSLLGWCMESTYCSIHRHRLINRGGSSTCPCAPIYGVGVLIMVNFFTPFTSSPLLFYIMATLVMSAWEYFCRMAAGDHHPYEILGLLRPPLQPEGPHLPGQQHLVGRRLLPGDLLGASGHRTAVLPPLCPGAPDPGRHPGPQPFWRTPWSPSASWPCSARPSPGRRNSGCSWNWAVRNSGISWPPGRTISSAAWRSNGTSCAAP